MISFKTISETNQNWEFVQIREQNLKAYLNVLTLSGSGVVLIWSLFDYLFYLPDIKSLLWLRLLTVAAYGLNLFISHRRNTQAAFKQHLIVGFYLGTLFCGLLMSFTGYYGSNYVYGFLFIIISWLCLIPLPFKKLLKHFSLFFITYNLTILLSSGFSFLWSQMLESNFLYLGVAIVGAAAGFFNNQSAAENFITNQEVTDSEAKYRVLIEKSQDGIVISQNGKVLLANKAIADLLGYTVDEMYTVFGPNSIAPEDRERVISIHEKRMKGEIDNVRYTASMLTKTNERIIFDIHSTSILMDNRPASLITMRDITEFSNIQNALKASEEKYRMLIDKANDGIIITQFGLFKFANRAFCHLMEYTEEEIIDRQFVDLLAPDDRQRLMDYHNKRMEGDRSQFIYECKGLTKSGKVVCLELNTTYIDYQGAPATFIIMRDFSERKTIEAELENSRKRYQNLIESIQEGLFVIQDQQFVFLNDAIVHLIGYRVEELLGKSFLEVIPPENQTQILERHRKRIQGEPIDIDVETNLLHKDGLSRIPVILSTKLTEFDGKPAVVGTAKDISERIRAEQELMRAHKKLEEINHSLENTIELRTKELTEANTQLLQLQKENLQSQFEMLKQQVNPHFLFNSLNVLSSLIKLEPELAEKFTEHLSKVYRYVLENKDNELVKLSTELDFLDAYLFLLNIRFMGKLLVTMEIPEEKRGMQIIPLALQLLIENAIKHNAMSKKSPLVIKIYIDNTDHLIVTNNLQERESYIASTGVGLQNIKHRYMLLNLEEPAFTKTEEEFIAIIPLIN